jgi:hypothetical protein
MNWLLSRLAHWLIGPGLTQVDDALMDGITLAINEESARMGLKPAPEA